MGREPGASAVKLYYRIGEVAGIVGVEPHVLRYWETEFPSIRPQKSRSGQRVYSRRDVDKLLRVKELLYAQRFTIAGARQRLKDLVGAPVQSGAVSDLSNKPQTAEFGDVGLPPGALAHDQAHDQAHRSSAPGVASGVAPSELAQVASSCDDAADVVDPVRQAAVCLRAALLGIREDVCQMLDGAGAASSRRVERGSPDGAESHWNVSSESVTSSPRSADCSMRVPFQDAPADDLQTSSAFSEKVQPAPESAELRSGNRRDLELAKSERQV